MTTTTTPVTPPPVGGEVVGRAPGSLKASELTINRIRSDGGADPVGFVYGPSFPERSELGRQALVYTKLFAAAPDLLTALQQMQSFVAVMFGHGPDAVIPESAQTPIGVPVKLGEIMRATQAAITKAGAA